MSKYIYEGKKLDMRTIRLMLSSLAGFGVFNTFQKSSMARSAKGIGVLTWLGVTLFDISIGVYAAGVTHNMLKNIEAAWNEVKEGEDEDGGSKD